MRGALFRIVPALALALALDAAAQTYPSKPIHIVDAFAPGGTTDILARLIGAEMTKSWGQKVLVENKTGANGIIGSEYVSRSAPDGYTMLVGSTSTLAVNQSLYKLNFDPVRDLAQVTMLASQPLIIVVHPSVQAKTLKELVQLARAKPPQLNYASPGVGNPLHLAVELFKSVTGTDMTHVPYNKGSAPAVTDLLGGQVQVMFAPMVVIPHVQAGKLRALAVTSSKRSPAAPDVPTVAEAGTAGYEVTIWNSAAVPAATPKDIVAKLSAEVGRIMQLPDIQKRLAASGLEALTSSPEQATAFVRAEVGKWAKVIKASGAKVE